MFDLSDLDPRRWPQAVAAFLVVSVVLPVGVVAVALWAYLFLPLPIPDLPDPQLPASSQITRIVDTEGNEIGVLRDFDTSIPVAFEDIPEVTKEAVIAAEDRRFYSHSGLDVRAAIRAAWADLRGRSISQGGSTITQQYVKKVFTGGKRTFARKIKEAVIASRIESKISKDEILYRYLSTIYFGAGSYGIGAAAESYFGKPVSELGLSESAMLAGLIRAPDALDPHNDKQAAEAARTRVLGQMRDQDRISGSEYDLARREQIRLVGVDPPTTGPATWVEPLVLQSATEPYFVDAVRRYLVTRYGDELVYRGGLTVETSFDPRIQDAAEKAVSSALAGTRPPLEMALVAVEPSTGFIRALVGGRDFDSSQVNLALGRCPELPTGPDGEVERPSNDEPVCLSGGGSGRQPGSAFKAVTLAAALDSGISPSKVYSGPSRYTFRNCVGECTVGNVESSSYGSLTLRQATWYSVNTAYAQVIEDVGVERTAAMAHELGLTMIAEDGVQPNGQPYGGSLTLGAAEVSPLDMAAAFSVFANRGRQLPATPVVQVLNSKGQVLEDNTERRGRQILPERTADTVNDILTGVVQQGTGRNADIGRPVAGKTGTSEDYGDAWFVGYTPDLAASVWMGYSDTRNRPLRDIKGTSIVYGGTIPARTFNAFMTDALQGVPPTPFADPESFGGGDIGPGARIGPTPTTLPGEGLPGEEAPDTTNLDVTGQPDPRTTSTTVAELPGGPFHSPTTTRPPLTLPPVSFLSPTATTAPRRRGSPPSS